MLKTNDHIDAQRVGVWGWSGGGTSSLHSIFRYPDLYQTAVAVAPVANLSYYDTIYEERYMSTPADNVDGYRDGSAIHFADQLSGNLLLIHGTADDNVHYQASELLINELVKHNKQFDMFIYPGRTHSIKEGKNTRLHLMTKITAFLEQHLGDTSPSGFTPKAARRVNEKANSSALFTSPWLHVASGEGSAQIELVIAESIFRVSHPLLRERP